MKVDEDDHIAIPNTRAGQTVTVHVEAPIPDEEWEEIKARINQRARIINEQLPEPYRFSDHGDLLYDTDGLPK